MSRNIFKYKYGLSQKLKGVTRYAGLLPLLELCEVMRLPALIAEHVSVRTGGQGYTDVQCILALIVLNLVGGKSLIDIEQLEQDAGLCRLFLSLESQVWVKYCGYMQLKRWRRQRTRVFPSVTALHDFLKHFNMPGDGAVQPPGHAQRRALSQAVKDINGLLVHQVHFAARVTPTEIATLEQDATLDAANKSTAQFCYKGFKGYQPLNTYWFEQGVIVHSEFREGNVPAGFEELSVLQSALAQLPDTVKQVFLRTDGAGYQEDLLRYCAEGHNERFGVIQFAISARMSDALRDAVHTIDKDDWHRLHKVDLFGDKIPTQQEWAECCFVPNWIGRNKHYPNYRYIVIREPLRNISKLPEELPFPVVETDTGLYKCFAIITNRLDMAGEDLIHWHRERCGRSEQIHKTQKIDLACHNLPSKYFGVNAAWWAIMCIALNITAILENIMGVSWRSVRLKSLRQLIINRPGNVTYHARQWIVKVSSRDPDWYHWINRLRQAIAQAGADPPKNIAA